MLYKNSKFPGMLLRVLFEDDTIVTYEYVDPETLENIRPGDRGVYKTEHKARFNRHGHWEPVDEMES